MVTQERMGSSEAVVIILHAQHITFEKHCQLIAPHHSNLFFVSSGNGKERCVTRQNGCIRDHFPTRSADYCVVTKGASPHNRDALRDRTKKCCKKVHE